MYRSKCFRDISSSQGVLAGPPENPRSDPCDSGWRQNSPAIQRWISVARDDPATLVASTPAGRLETWTFYFETLRHRDTPPAVEQKPWLNCAAAADYKAKLRGVGAFIWPQDFTLEHLRITLRRGNPQPFALGNKDDLPGVVDLTINGVRRRVPVTNKPRMLRTAFLD